jgi:cytochrome c
MDRLLNRGLLAAGAALACAAMAGPCFAADPAGGKAVFTQQCSVCHSAARNGPNIVGPNLYGVVDRAAGSLKGFAYSSVLKSAAFAWSPAKLKAYIAAPAVVMPGNHMPYAGLKSPGQLDDLVAYLQSLK